MQNINVNNKKKSLSIKGLEQLPKVYYVGDARFNPYY
jgi:hypothetical protein